MARHGRERARGRVRRQRRGQHFQQNQHRVVSSREKDDLTGDCIDRGIVQEDRDRCDKQKQQEPNDRTIVVQVVQGAPGQRPTLKINQDPASWDELQNRLTDIFKTRAERVMFVKGDDEVPFSDVAQVIDIAHAAGVDKVGLITAKIEAGQ